jgi:hypothetical protein
MQRLRVRLRVTRLLPSGLRRPSNTRTRSPSCRRSALTLERAKCRMLSGELPEANAELRALVQELEGDPQADTALRFDARRTWANSEYYMTWLQRLEGASEEEWLPRIERARQVYKLLAEDDATAAETKLDVQEDLEAAIRLARMDLGELAGLPLPSQ